MAGSGPARTTLKMEFSADDDMSSKETCALCGSLAAPGDLLSPEEHDGACPQGGVPLRAQLLAIANNKALPEGRVCGACVRRAADAFAFQGLVAESAGRAGSLSDKIRALRRRLHQLTQKVDVFIVVGEAGAGAGGKPPAYSERDVIMVDRDALAAAAAADERDLELGPNARGDTVYQCSVCPQSFQKLSLYTAHAAGHPSDSVHSCWTCGVQFASQAALAAHRPLHEPRAPHAVCHLCSAVLPGAAELRRHEATCPPRCPLCGEQSMSRALLSEHAAQMHGPQARPPHLCPVCFESFERGEQLSAHALRHRQAKQFVCGADGCILRFATRNHVMAHVRKCHGAADEVAAEEEEQRRVCHHCNRTFATEAALKRHSRVHSGQEARGGRGRRGPGRPRKVRSPDIGASADEDVVEAAADALFDADDHVLEAEYLEEELELEDEEAESDTKPDLAALLGQ